MSGEPCSASVAATEDPWWFAAFRADFLNLLKILESGMVSGAMRSLKEKYRAVDPKGTSLSQEIGPERIHTYIQACAGI